MRNERCDDDFNSSRMMNGQTNIACKPQQRLIITDTKESIQTAASVKQNGHKMKINVLSIE